MLVCMAEPPHGVQDVKELMRWVQQADAYPVSSHPSDHQPLKEGVVLLYQSYYDNVGHC